MAKIASLLLLLLALPLAAADPVDLESFEVVWRTVRDNHWDPKFGGLDWNKVHSEFRPRIEKAQDRAAVRALLTEMLGRIGKSHYGIIPAGRYADMGTRHGDGVAGFDVRVLGGRALVTRVDAGSPAERAGVRTGWQLLAVDGEEAAPPLERVAEHFAKSTMQQVALRGAVMNRVAGRPGAVVKLRFRDAGDREVTVELTRVQPSGRLSRLAMIPPVPMRFEGRRLADVGYFTFNAFLEPEPVTKALENTVLGCGDCAGFVLDLRGNMGGLALMAMGIAGFFVDMPGARLGTLHTRDFPLHLAINPRRQAFRGPLAVLIDGCSGSAAEFFSGGLQDLKRARLFGSRTVGAALPADILQLPNGDRLNYVVANYVSQSGKELEGAGVEPDVEIVPTREALLAGRDPVLEAALEWIHAQSKK
ncbi:MAG: S41 family peptidase [Bryobacteraceae bacterium]